MPHHGLKIAAVCETDFRDFAAHHATSPEIGSIQTSFDPGVKKQQKRDYEQKIVGLWGCGTLCAVADFHLYQSAIESSSEVLKLDSVVVSPKLRRRGLASMLVARTIADLIADSGRRIASIYAHAVHPATVRLLRRLQFDDPHAIGAPLSHINLDGNNQDMFLTNCATQVRDRENQMKLQCAFCRNADKRARPWCLPRGQMPSLR